MSQIVASRPKAHTCLVLLDRFLCCLLWYCSHAQFLEITEPSGPHLAGETGVGELRELTRPGCYVVLCTAAANVVRTLVRFRL